MPNVCDVLIDVIAEAGTRQVFGIPGDAINSFVDAMRRQDAVEFIQVRHEETGAFAAGTQAKLTGRLGVCAGTAGPGAVHLLNGLYDAKMDHAPVLAITGQVPIAMIGSDYHQEVDLEALFADVAIFNQTVMSAEMFPSLAVQACQAALAHRGVAHLSIPEDVAGQGVAHSDRRHPVFVPTATMVPGNDDLDAAAKLLNDAGTVTILAGIGCAGARDELIAVAETLAAPIVRTLRAKDVLPDTHALAIGGLGLLGGRPGLDAVEACDALLMVGTDFPYRDFYPDTTPAVQIDIEPTRLGRRYPVTHGLAGHAGPTLATLAQRLKRKEDRSFLQRHQKKMADWRDAANEDETDGATPIRPQRLARAIGDAARDDAVFVNDTGAVTVWGARHLRLRDGQRFTLSSSLASMAFAMPGAIGAQLAYPDRQIIALSGDGGLSMLLGDFATAVKYDLPITVVVFNNGKLGLIQFEQESEGLPEHAVRLPEIDFAAVARACGGVGFTVTGPEKLDETLAQALATDAPCLVDVRIAPDEPPMPPRIEASQALGYGIAKMKEFFGA